MFARKCKWRTVPEVGEDVNSQSEDMLLENVEKLVVLKRSKQAIIIELEKSVQLPDEGAEKYLTKLKDLARQAGFSKTVKCPCTPAVDVVVNYSDEIVLNRLVAGMTDIEMQRELIKIDNMILPLALKIVTDNERAKRSVSEFAIENSISNKKKKTNKEISYKAEQQGRGGALQVPRMW